MLAPCLVALLAVALRFDQAVVQLGRSLGVLNVEDKWFGMHPQETTLYSGRSDYQSIVVVKWRGDITLYIDGFSQFSSREEFRYHEALVHPIMAAAITSRPCATGRQECSPVASLTSTGAASTAYAWATGGAGGYA